MRMLRKAFISFSAEFVVHPAAEVLASYVLGSLSFPGIYARIRGIDLAKDGEGHLGATSIYTATKSVPLFLLLGILDAAKGTVAYYLFGVWGLVTAMIGHMFSVFFKFTGGNAVSVYYGGVLAANPLLATVVLLEPITARFVRSNARHALYMIYRAIPCIFLPSLAPAYLILLLRHAWFYYVRFRQGSS